MMQFHMLRVSHFTLPILTSPIVFPCMVLILQCFSSSHTSITLFFKCTLMCRYRHIEGVWRTGDGPSGCPHLSVCNLWPRDLPVIVQMGPRSSSQGLHEREQHPGCGRTVRGTRYDWLGRQRKGLLPGPLGSRSSEARLRTGILPEPLRRDQACWHFVGHLTYRTMR